MAGDIDLYWYEIETPHFRITYHDPLGKAAQRLAVVAEKAHEVLAPLLKHTPRFRTEVVLSDDVDFSNGSATPILFNTIHLYLTAPDNRSDLNDYDDWLWNLFVHEYTHILHLDTVNGLPRWVNEILGLGINNYYTPNQFQPRFFIEGFAVVEETDLSTSGRLRSSLFDMYLRMQTLEKRFLRLDQVTHETHYFPFGNAPYLYGSFFLRYLVKRYDPNLLPKISHRYGGCFNPLCWVPYFLSSALTHVTKDKLSYKDLYQDFRKDMEARYQTQQDKVLQQGLTETQALTSVFVKVDRPLFSKDGQSIYVIAAPFHQRPGIYRYEVSTKTLRKEFYLDGGVGLSLSKDNTLAALGQRIPFRANYDFHDLVLYSFAKQRLVPLSQGLRTTNPAISPDKQMIAFEVNTRGTRKLGLLKMPTQEELATVDSAHASNPAHVTDLAHAAELAHTINPTYVAVPEVWNAHAYKEVSFPLPQADYDQVYTPVWSPDGRKIAFSMWKEGGYRDIYLYHLETKRLVPITQDRAIDMDPKFSPDGKYLYFVSDRTGIYNLYAYRFRDQTLLQVSNVLSGVFAPDISPDGKRCAFVGFFSDGFLLEMMELDENQFWVAAPAPMIREEASQIEQPQSQFPVKRYQPARTLFRSALSLLSLRLPILSAPGPYGQSFGFLFPMEDVVGWHRFDVGIAFSTGRADAVEATVGYQYLGLWNPIYIQATRSLNPRYGWLTTQGYRTYDEETWSLSFGTDLPVYRGPIRSFTVSLGYQLSYTRDISPPLYVEPFEQILQGPQTGRFSTVELGLFYSDARRFIYSIGPEQGRVISFVMALANPAWGSQYQVYTFQGRITQYIQIPWPFAWAKNHVLSLTYRGGYSMGDLSHRGVFYVGGFPSVLSVLQNLTSGRFLGQPTLRGYAPNSFFGEQMHILNVEYRFPIVWIERGYGTLPFYLSRLHGALYLDYGGAFSKAFSFDKFGLGLGLELRLDASLLYFLPFTLQLGYAHGFFQRGEDQVYLLVNQRF